MAGPLDNRRRVSQLRLKLDMAEADQVLPQIEQAATEQPTAETLGLLGEAYLRVDRPQDAIIPLAAATGLSDHAKYASLLARALMQIGRVDDALLIAQRILRRDPRNRDALDIMQRVRG